MQSLRSLRGCVRTLSPSHRTTSRCLPTFYQLSLQRATSPWSATTRSLTRSALLLNTKDSKSDLPGVTKEIADPIPPPAAPVNVLDRLPAFARPIKPYLELTRIDKPIGTLLLYWPCGNYFPLRITGYGSDPLDVSSSMVHYYGIHRKSSPDNYSAVLPRLVWYGSDHHARRRMHD